jgi:hypothetical protein
MHFCDAKRPGVVVCSLISGLEHSSCIFLPLLIADGIFGLIAGIG